jgi:predicted alpha/beta-hydrolase family hydrolase
MPPQTSARRRLGRQGDRRGGRRPAPTSRSLEDVVVGALGELRAAGVGGCPVCGERSLHADGCVTCGSELS